MLSDLVLATGVFLVLARPEVAISFVIRSKRLSGGWFEEHLAVDELERLMRFARVLGWAGLVLLLGWSFTVGALLTVLRLPAG